MSTFVGKVVFFMWLDEICLHFELLKTPFFSARSISHDIAALLLTPLLLCYYLFSLVSKHSFLFPTVAIYTYIDSDHDNYTLWQFLF